MSEQTTKKLRKIFDDDLNEYRAIPFWSWNNSLDEETLCRQIEDMKSVGMGGFIMHARIGLTDEYLGEKWFSCIDACLKKARELNMKAWVYDENGWPSGFVGGKLLEREDFRAQFLRYKVTDSFDASAFCVFRRENGRFIRLAAPVGGLTEYHCIYLCTSPANTDILNPEVMQAFINETHEEYYRRFPDSFGRELAGFFTDEPQCYRAETAYSRFIRDEYLHVYGEDVVDYLPYLFTTDEAGYEFREHYYKIMNRLYAETFYKTLYDWCEEHHCMLTGHSIEESSLNGQMIGGAGVMPTYEFEHIPGIDKLGRDCATELSPKQIGSVASQLGIRHVLTETFACCGYDVTPKELKSIAEFQYFNGVNMMCHHLYPYSLSAQGKTDHPPVFSKQNNWFEQFREFNEYFTRLGYLVSNTDDHYDVLIIHPLRSVYLDHLRGNKTATEPLEKAFRDLLADLRRHGVCYHFADETMLEKYGKIRHGNLTIGECTYDKIIVPAGIKTISTPTYDLLREFEGGLVLLGKPARIDGKPAEVDLTETLTYQQVLDGAAFRFSCEDGKTGLTARAGKPGDFVFIKNYSRLESSTFTTEGIADRYRAIDLLTLELSDIPETVTLGPAESLILVRDEDAKPAVLHPTEEIITDRFRVTGITDNYLVLDNASVSKNGTDFGEVLPLQRIFEDLLREDYRGVLWIRQTFRTEKALPMKLILEKGHFRSLALNGKELTLTQNDFDVNFAEADISDAVKSGENVFLYSIDYYQHDGVHFALFDPLATESLRNCLYYDTHIENVYLKGDFTVNAENVIGERNALPPLSSNLAGNGYPFFKGELTLDGTYEYDGNGKREIVLDGRFIAAELRINGVRTDLAMDFKKDVTSLLIPGENYIQITLRSSLRNLFGPHHFAPDPEPIGVSPTTFTLRGTWNGGISPKYTPKYQSVPFGTDRIRMIRT